MVKWLFFLSLLCSVALPTVAAERFINLGASVHSGDYYTGDTEIDRNDKRDTGVVLRAGIRNMYGDKQQHALGLGIDAQTFIGDFLLGFRAVDYQYQLNSDFRVGGFVGAAQLDSGAAQTGYFGGLNISRFNAVMGMDAVLEFQYAHGAARDRLLRDDPEGTLPDMFVNIYIVSLSLGWRF